MPNFQLAEKGIAKIEDILSQDIEILDLNSRTSNILRVGISKDGRVQRQIYTVGELTKKTEQDLMGYRWFGRKSVAEIIFKLNKYGLRLTSPQEVQYEI